jgi:hypothetical protein
MAAQDMTYPLLEREQEQMSTRESRPGTKSPRRCHRAWPFTSGEPVVSAVLAETNDDMDEPAEVTTRSLPDHVQENDAYSLRNYRLRCVERSLLLARSMLREATEYATRAQANDKLRYSLDRALVNAERAVDRVKRELRVRKSRRVYRWAAWNDRCDEPNARHGEALSLREAKKQSLEALQRTKELEFYGSWTEAKALVTGPGGARYTLEWQRRADESRRYRWRSLGRESRYTPAAAMTVTGNKP